MDALIISQPLLPCPTEGFTTQHLPANAWLLRPRNTSQQPTAGGPAGASATGGAAGARAGGVAAGAGAAGSGTAGPSPGGSGGGSVAAGGVPWACGGWSGHRRPVVFVTGRVHPGETPSSYVTQVTDARVLRVSARGFSTRFAAAMNFLAGLGAFSQWL